MLDASLRMSIVNMFRKLKEDNNVSVIYITHDLATAYYTGDRIAVMLRGWIVEMGPTEQVLGNPLHPYTQNLKTSIPSIKSEESWEEKVDLAVIETDEYTRTGCKFAGRCPAVMDICHDNVPPSVMHEGRSVKCFLYDDDGRRRQEENADAGRGLALVFRGARVRARYAAASDPPLLDSNLNLSGTAICRLLGARSALAPARIRAYTVARPELATHHIRLRSHLRRQTEPRASYFPVLAAERGLRDSSIDLVMMAYSLRS